MRKIILKNQEKQKTSSIMSLKMKHCGLNFLITIKNILTARENLSF